MAGESYDEEAWFVDVSSKDKAWLNETDYFRLSPGAQAMEKTPPLLSLGAFINFGEKSEAAELPLQLSGRPQP